jgi:hypothetical protein
MSRKPIAKMEQEGSNLFADLGFPDAAERYTKACLGIQVVQILTAGGTHGKPGRNTSHLSPHPTPAAKPCDDHPERGRGDEVLFLLHRGRC